jgi:integrase
VTDDGVDLIGKHGRVRTAPMPTWVKVAIDAWTSASGVTADHVFRPVNRRGYVSGERLGEKVVWQMLKKYAAEVGVPGVAPHDLRRTCAKLCRAAGGELEQIQLLLGHASVQTTEDCTKGRTEPPVFSWPFLPYEEQGRLRGADAGKSRARHAYISTLDGQDALSVYLREGMEA